MSRFKRWKAEKRHAHIRSYVTHFPFEVYEGVHGVTLTELRPVKRKDVENWVRRYCRELFDEQDMLQRVGVFYEASESIPMEDLLVKLKAVLKEGQPAY